LTIVIEKINNFFLNIMMNIADFICIFSQHSQTIGIVVYHTLVAFAINPFATTSG